MRSPLLYSMACLLVSLAAATPVPAMADTTPTQAPTLMNTSRPLLFSELVALQSDAHRTLTLPDQRKSFSFAAATNVLPLTFAEANQALRHYPVVFVAEGDGMALVALVGVQPGTNAFVDSKGEWRPGTYIPAYVRGYPFISIRPSAGADPILALDPNAADFQEKGGQALLQADGQPSEHLKGIMAYQGEYRLLAEHTYTMTQALKEAGVLEEGGLKIQPQGEAPAQQIGGFWVVSEAKLKALDAQALHKLLQADALGLAYAHLFSLASLGNLMVQPTQAAVADTSKSASKSKATRSKDAAP